MGRHDDDLRLRIQRPDGPRGGDAVQARHLEVHQDPVRVEDLVGLHRIPSARALVHRGGDLFYEAADQRTHGRIVLHE